MTGRLHLVLVVLMLLVIRQASGKRGHGSYKERIKEKLEERNEETEEREDQKEKSHIVGWRRKRSTHGTELCRVIETLCGIIYMRRYVELFIFP